MKSSTRGTRALGPRECMASASLLANIVFPLASTPSMATSALCRLRQEAILAAMPRTSVAWPLGGGTSRSSQTGEVPRSWLFTAWRRRPPVLPSRFSRTVLADAPRAAAAHAGDAFTELGPNGEAVASPKNRAITWRKQLTASASESPDTPGMTTTRSAERNPADWRSAPSAQQDRNDPS